MGCHFETYDDDNNDDEAEHTIQSSKCKKRVKARIIRSVFFNKETDPEKHYRELDMLFTPWRNEETDLLSSSSSYFERYLVLKDVIEEQKKQYTICTDTLDDIEKQLNATEEDSSRFEHIAPLTINTEYQDEEEGMQDLHPDFNETYDLSHDIGIPSALSNAQEQLIHNELKDNEYRQMVGQLNKEQKLFFYHILHEIKTSGKPFYSFLSGGAGVGKTHVTKALYQAAIK